MSDALEQGQPCTATAPWQQCPLCTVTWGSLGQGDLGRFCLNTVKQECTALDRLGQESLETDNALPLLLPDCCWLPLPACLPAPPSR